MEKENKQEESKEVFDVTIINQETLTALTWKDKTTSQITTISKKLSEILNITKDIDAIEKTEPLSMQDLDFCD